MYVLLLEVDVGEVETDRLGAAEAGGVDELDQGAVPERERALAVERGELPLDLGAARRVRAAPSECRRNARTAASLRAIVAGASRPPGRAEPRRAT